MPGTFASFFCGNSRKDKLNRCVTATAPSTVPVFFNVTDDSQIQTLNNSVSATRSISLPVSSSSNSEAISIEYKSASAEIPIPLTSSSSAPTTVEDNHSASKNFWAMMKAEKEKTNPTKEDAPEFGSSPTHRYVSLTNYT